MTETSTNGSINYLAEENSRLRENEATIRREKDEALKLARKLEGEMKIQEVKMKSINNEKERCLGQVRKFRQALEQEKKERIKMMEECSGLKSMSTRKDAEISTLKAQAQNLQKENDRLKKTIEEGNLKKVSQLKQKQGFLNTIKVLQSKLQAASMESKFFQNKNKQIESDLNSSKQHYNELLDKYNKKELGVQEIYKDEEKTKQRLLGQFQNKISDKEQEMKEQLQKYIAENLHLRKEVRQVKQELLKHQ